MLLMTPCRMKILQEPLALTCENQSFMTRWYCFQCSVLIPTQLESLVPNRYPYTIGKFANEPELRFFCIKQSKYYLTDQNRVFLFRKDLAFKAPAVPILPAVAIFFNIYLMLKLPGLTWARLGIWICLGMQPLRHSSLVTLDIFGSSIDFQLIAGASTIVWFHSAWE